MPGVLMRVRAPRKHIKSKPPPQRVSRERQRAAFQNVQSWGMLKPDPLPLEGVRAYRQGQRRRRAEQVSTGSSDA